MNIKQSDISKTTPAELQRIIVDALIAGSVIGIFGYLYFWVSLSLWTGINHTHPVLFLLHSAIILIEAVTTYLFIRFHRYAPHQYISLKQQYLVICVLLSAFHWGGLLTYMAYFVGLSAGEQFMMQLILAGFATIGGTIFGIVKNVGFAYAALVFMPHLIMSNWLNIPDINFLTFITLTLIGFIYITNRTIQYNYVRFVQTYRHTKLYADSMENLSKTDFLTKLNNRFSFQLDYLEIWRKSVESKQPLSLLYIEIDDLNPLIQNHGHQAGELCLVQLAKKLSKIVVAPNVLASYESGKFIIALPNHDSNQTKSFAKTLMQNINRDELITGLPESLLENILGVATIAPTRETNPEYLIDLAIESANKQKPPLIPRNFATTAKSST